MFENELKNEKNPYIKKVANYLEQKALEDPLFAKNLGKENKSLKECWRYIIGELYKNMYREGSIGYCCGENEELYELAIHYYDEDDIKINAMKEIEKVKMVDESKQQVKVDVKDKPKKKVNKKKDGPVEGQIGLELF